MVTVVGGLLVGIVLKLLIKVVAMPLLGADPVNTAYHFLEGNRALLPMATVSILVAGFAEETVYRGFLFERLQKIFGASTAAKSSIVLMTRFYLV